MEQSASRAIETAKEGRTFQTSLANSRRRIELTAAFGLGVSVLLAACAGPESPSTGVTASDPSRITRSGFLSDYTRLTTATGGDGALCWRQPDVDLRRYDKVLINRILVTLKTDKQAGVDPSDLKTLVDYFHKALEKDLKPQWLIVDQTGPDVLVLRIALTNLVPTQVSRSLAGTAIPYAFAAEMASGPATGRPAGSTPYLGETGIEMQFVDGASEAIIAECADTQIGRKYAAEVDAGASGATQTWIKGYMSSFQTWAYARDAFDKWATLIARRLSVLRGATSAK